MKRSILLGALLVGGSLCLPDSATAHGGTYRGPGDTVPPGGGGGGGAGGPATGAPGAAAPGPAGPSTPGAGTPGAPGSAPATANNPMTGGGPSGPDLTQWQFWWGFNKDPYLNLKARIHAGGVTTGSGEMWLGRGQEDQAKDLMRPSATAIREKVVPALKKALASESNNDILTGAMIALAKIGDAVRDDGTSEFADLFEDFLSHSNQEVAETGALALGILANEASVPTLVELMIDGPRGRKLVGSTSVPVRTRAFAAYGLGLVASATSNMALRKEIAEYLVDVLELPNFAQRDIKVAAMTSFGMTKLDWAEEGAELEGAEGEEQGSNERHVRSRRTQIAYLLDYLNANSLRANSSKRHWYVVAHAPTALGRLLDGDTPPELKAEVAAALIGATGKHSDFSQEEVQAGATLALGQIGDCDADKMDVEIRRELARLIADGQPQIKRFAMISLAQAGSRPGTGETPLAGLEGRDGVRGELLKHMSRGQTAIRAWAALALGVLERGLTDNGQTSSPETADAMRLACQKENGPDMIGAYAIGLGLRRHIDALDVMLAKFEQMSVEEAKGDVAIGLGLLEDRKAIEPIQQVVEKSQYRPELLRSTAIALGLLGDKDVVDKLIDMLKSSTNLATQAALAAGLGAIGDSRSLDPLVEMLGDQDITARARGFAAAALGIVCDKELFPWNSKIATNINYRANTTTLTSPEGTGILDIL